LHELGVAHSVDSLASLLNQEPTELMEKLFELQLIGKVQQNYVGMWERV